MTMKQQSSRALTRRQSHRFLLSLGLSPPLLNHLANFLYLFLLLRQVFVVVVHEIRSEQPSVALGHVREESTGGDSDFRVCLSACDRSKGGELKTYQWSRRAWRANQLAWLCHD